MPGTAVERGIAAALSAAGSLPQHMMALVVALSIADGSASVARAGWISASFTAGLLIGSLALPLAGVVRISRRAAAVLLVGPALALSAIVGTGAGVGWADFASWLFVGFCCSGLNMLGSLFAAARPDGKVVLQLRLALVLLGAAALFAVSHWLGTLQGYRDALAALIVVLLTVLPLALLYRPPPVAPVPARASGAGRAALISLVALTFFFVGQPGFTAYAAHIAGMNGIPGAALPLVYALCKCVAAMALLGAARSPATVMPDWVLSTALALAVVGMSQATSTVVFCVSLLAWEVAVNLQSTRFQAAVLRRHPSIGGRWLTAAIAAGAAVGPILHGGLLASGWGRVFVLISVASAFVPLAWAMWCRTDALPTRPPTGRGPLASG